MRINVTPTAVHDKPPTDQEIRGVVGQLRNGRAGCATGMKAKHLKEWLHGIKHEESENRVAGEGDRWRLFVRLMQAVWESGTVPTQMSWMIIVLLPKGGGDYRGIGLLNPMWKAMEKIMMARLSVIKLHDSLHGGLPRRGTGTTIIEAKLNQ